MSRFTYLIIGLILGFGAGVIGMQLGLDRYLVERPAASPEAQAATDTFFLCKFDLSGKDSALVVQSTKLGAKTLLFPGKTDQDVFRITESTTTQYRAVSDSPDFPEAFATIELNRVSGEMTETLRIPNKSAKLLADICAKKIPPSECRQRIDIIREGDWISCMSVANDMECPKWLAGSNVTSRFRFQCRPANRNL
jgi:hypothetical protein